MKAYKKGNEKSKIKATNSFAQLQISKKKKKIYTKSGSHTLDDRNEKKICII